MTENVVELKNVYKTFRINYDKTGTIFESLSSSIKERTPIVEFNALSNVSFNIKKGEVFGIIGQNGSGKTTLLKTICGIVSPSKGIVKTKGKLVPFLQLGSCFHPDLTAIENIKLYGMILGIKKKNIAQKIPKILEFSELERFKDTKVKSFSSGMFARLAFATAIQAEPDILVIDEILSVGDLAFQQKSYNSFLEMKKANKTIIYVTHNLDDVQRLCDRAALMFNGFAVAVEKPNIIVDKYRTIIEKTPNFYEGGIAKEIGKFYTEILERPPDLIGTLEYVYKIKKGELKLSDIPKIFRESTEYARKNREEEF